jgi:hypothetical protein
MGITLGAEGLWVTTILTSCMLVEGWGPVMMFMGFLDSRKKFGIDFNRERKTERMIKE